MLWGMIMRWHFSRGSGLIGHKSFPPLFMDIFYWNIRGLNNPAKQRVLKSFLKKYKVGICCIAEHKMGASTVDISLRTIRSGWKNLNYNNMVDSPRILVWWDPNCYNVELLKAENQVVHCQVTFVTSQEKFYLSAVHGSNDPSMRTALWHSLVQFASSVTNPWLCIGDFNVVRTSDEKYGGKSISHQHSTALNDCIFYCNLFDIKWTGHHLTWSNNQGGNKRICCKLDRAMVNPQWIAQFQISEAIFLDPSISDHSPILVKIANKKNFGPKPFRFINAWMDHPEFLDIIKKS